MMPEETKQPPDKPFLGEVAVPKDACQIVITGTIDPRQHHPLWYKLIGCIDEEETKRGVESFVAAPNGFRFDTSKFTIVCEPDKWMIETVAEVNQPRIIDVATLVFSRLNEIYISAFGVNRSMNFLSATNKPASLMAKMISDAGLPFPAGEAMCQLAYSVILEAAKTTIQIGALPFNEHSLNIFYNRHHSIPPQQGYYDIGPMLKEAAHPDWTAAKEFANSLKQRLGMLEEPSRG